MNELPQPADWPLVLSETTPGENWRTVNAYSPPMPAAPAFKSTRDLRAAVAKARARTRSRDAMRRKRQAVAMRDVKTTRELLELGLIELGRGLFITVEDRADYCRFCSHKTSDADRICTFCRAELESPAGLPYCRDLLLELAEAVEQLPAE